MLILAVALFDPVVLVITFFPGKVHASVIHYYLSILVDTR
jgi:hypothetical protein